MGSETLVRLLVTSLLCGGGVLAVILLNRLTLARADGRIGRFEAYRPGLPALVYFTTPGCAPCKAVQRPTIRRLQEQLGAWFQLIEVDAAEHPEVAKEWGVMSVPTTFVVDAAGRPRHVNHGVAPAEKLVRQLGLEDWEI